MPLSLAASLLPCLLLLAAPALAQRAADGPPATDPFGRRAVPAQAVPGGRYRAHTLAGHTLTVSATDGSTLQVRPWAAGVVRLLYLAPGRAARPDTSVSVVQPAAAFATPETASAAPQLLNQPTRLVLAYGQGASAGAVVLDKRTLRLSIAGAGGALAQAGPAFVRRAAAPTPATAPGPGGTAVRFGLAPGEQLFGTGSRALPLDRRGYRLELYNQAHYASQNGEPNLNIALPVVLSSRGYLLFFDHHAAGYLDLGKADPNVLEYGNEGLNSLAYFVVTGQIGRAHV